VSASAHDSRGRNQLLTDARLRLASPSGSGEPMSPQEVAEAMNAYLWQEHLRTKVQPMRSREPTVLDHRFVSAYEAGRHRWPSRQYRAAFRHVLKVSTDAELGFYPDRRRRRPSAADASVRPLRAGQSSDGDQAHPQVAKLIDSPDTGESNADMNRRQVMAGLVSPVVTALLTSVPGMSVRAQQRRREDDPDTDALAAELSKVRKAYQHSRYAAAMAALPELLADIHHEPKRHDARRLAALEAEAYQVASGLLLKNGEPILATIAAERCAAAAERSGDQLAIGCGARAYAHCLMAVGHPREAVRLVVASADGLSGQVDSRRPAALSVHGALLLRGAIAAARAEDRDQAHALLDEADRAARHLGADRNLLWTAFGPTNVTAHRVGVAVELGDAGTAVAYANKIDLAALDLPERKAMVLLDTARALSQWGKWDRAFDAIRRAERHAPEEIRQRAAVHHLIDELAQRSPATLRRHVQNYADQIRTSR
jgi:hypothetical protein